MGSGLCTHKEVKIIMLGLDAAGKTSVLYKLKLGEIITTIPTIGFNVEELKYKNYDFIVWDVGGRDKIRPLQRHYYKGSDALIFVVDSNDKDRMEQARDELHSILSEEEMKEVVLLVLANKQDVASALSSAEVVEALGLDAIRHQWYIQSASAIKGDGLFEGLDWLTNTLANRKMEEMLVKPVNQTVSKATGLAKEGVGHIAKRLLKKWFT